MVPTPPLFSSCLSSSKPVFSSITVVTISLCLTYFEKQSLSLSTFSCKSQEEIWVLPARCHFKPKVTVCISSSEGITPKVHIQIHPPLWVLHTVSLPRSDDHPKRTVCALAVPLTLWASGRTLWIAECEAVMSS